MNDPLMQIYEKLGLTEEFLNEVQGVNPLNKSVHPNDLFEKQFYSARERARSGLPGTGMRSSRHKFNDNIILLENFCDEKYQYSSAELLFPENLQKPYFLVSFTAQSAIPEISPGIGVVTSTQGGIDLFCEEVRK